jgi:hypothetical protein
MKPHWFLFLFVLPYALAAQETPSPRHAFSLSISPEVSFLPGRDEAPAVIQPGFRIAASYHRRLTDRFWLRAGLGFAHLRLGARFEHPSGNRTWTDELNLLTVPLALRYRINSRWYAEFEASGNLVVKGGSSRNEFNLGAGLGLGYQHPVGRNTFLFVQPTVRLLYPVDRSSPFPANRNDKLSLGIDLGFRKEF